MSPKEQEGNDEFPEPVTDEDDDLEPDDLVSDEPEEEPERKPARRFGPDVASQLASAEAQIADLKTRLGNAVTVGGQRLKEYQEEVRQWLERMHQWHAEELKKTKNAGFEEGVRSVEKRLLSKLGAEDKADYLEEARLSPAQPAESPRQELPAFQSKRTETTVSRDEIEAAVERYVGLGVSIDQLDQSSVKAVVDSGAKALSAKHRQLEEKIEELSGRLEGRLREASGASRVSRGGGTPKPASASADEKRLAEVNKRLADLRRLHRVHDAAPLLAEKKELETRLARVASS